MDIQEAIKFVKPVLDHRRFEHTLRVMETAQQLAVNYNIPVEKVELAAVLHDYAKNWPAEKLRNYIREHELSQTLLEFDTELWHGPVAAHFFEKESIVGDEEVLAAIRHHTTGRSGMGKIELIIYLADYIEPGRSFPGLDEVRKASEENLKYACWLVSRNTIQFLLGKQVSVYPDSIFAYNDLTRQIKLEGLLDG